MAEMTENIKNCPTILFRLQQFRTNEKLRFYPLMMLTHGGGKNKWRMGVFYEVRSCEYRMWLLEKLLVSVYHKMCVGIRLHRV